MKLLYFLICVLYPAAVSAVCGFAMEYSYKRNALQADAAAKGNYMDAFPAVIAIYVLLAVSGGIIMYFRRSYYPQFALLALFAAAAYALYKLLLCK